MADTLKDKVCIVTGGSNGIGAAIVARFLDQGAKVASVDVVPQPDSDSGSRTNFKCDVSSEPDMEKLVKDIVGKWGQLDVLVNCAGVMDGFARVDTLTNATWQRVISINLTAPMNLMRLCIPHLLESVKAGRGGNIVNIGSAASISGASAGAAYTASKHGILGLTRNTAYAYGVDGLRCNIVLPGGIETDIMGNSFKDGEAEKVVEPAVGEEVGAQQQQVPVWFKKIDQVGLERITPFHKSMVGTTKADDVARAVMFLATAPSVSGAEITVDKGWMAC